RTEKSCKSLRTPCLHTHIWLMVWSRVFNLGGKQRAGFRLRRQSVAASLPRRASRQRSKMLVIGGGDVLSAALLCDGSVTSLDGPLPPHPKWGWKKVARSPSLARGRLLWRPPLSSARRTGKVLCTDLRGARVLVVEDHWPVANALKSLLEAEGA